MVVNPGMRRNLRSALTRLYNREVHIFAGGRNGYLHRFTTLELNQLSTGTTPVTAVTDPVGFVADTRLGMALGAELCTDTQLNNAAAWVIGAGWAVSGGLGTATASSTNLQNVGGGYTSGKPYKVTYTLSGVTGGSVSAWIRGTFGVNRTANGTYTEIIFAASSADLLIFSGVAFTGSVDNISVRLFEGNHCIQATAAARPTWQVDATGHYYLSFLGTDDSLTSATGGGGVNGFMWCGVIQPTGGAGTLRTIFADNGVNTGYKVQIDVNNKLSFSAGDGAAFTTLVSTAALSIGTKYLLTVRDNGTNLSVQINSATAETVARPVVSAGTAGYTLFKDNGAASSYLIANFFPDVMWTNTGGTDAEVADAQAYCRAQAGL